MELSLSSNTPLHGEIFLPGDKSISHRAALFAALASGESRIAHFLDAGVTRAMLNALTTLGIEWKLDGDTLFVQGGTLHEPKETVFCGNSGTTFRLLAGAIAAAGIPCVLDGTPGLRKRPMNRIVAPLQSMGVPVSTPNGCAPVTFSKRTTPLKPLDYSLPVASAQVKSCLILAALGAKGTTHISEPGPSRDHTERMLSAMGASVRSNKSLCVEVDGPVSSLKPLNVSLPGDISSAAFLLAAAALVPGSEIIIRDVGVNPTRTGILDAFVAMGAKLELLNRRDICGEPVADIHFVYAPLKAIDVKGDLVVRMIDEFPVFAAVASSANGVTRVREAEELRYKETDRISLLAGELRKLGVEINECRDGFDLTGGKCSGGVVEAHGDHRLAMSLALLGLVAEENKVEVRGAEILNESFPEFLPSLDKLGVKTWRSA